MDLRWTLRARSDLRQIRAYIAADNPAAAEQWIDRLRRRARLAAEAPGAGRIVPEFGREDIREAIVGRYRLVYRILNDAIHVLTVFEGHRLLRTDDVPDDPTP